MGRFILLVPFIALLTLLPFFEGGETSTGLFFIHSLTLASVAICCLLSSRLSVPKFAVSFVPFFLVLTVSFIKSPYKYASFLNLWDYFIAGIWAVAVSTLVYADREKFQIATVWVFVAAVCSTIAGILIYNTHQIMRISASFLNPNDYASFALLLFCFGLFCFERETSRLRKTILLTLLSILLLTVALSFSRDRKSVV